jgi:hypothetical protein
MPDRDQPKDQPKPKPADEPKEEPQPEEVPPEEQEQAEPEPPEEANYQPIEPKDEDENPVWIKVPKTDEEVAEEGTKLALADAKASGGTVPFLSPEAPKNKRIWSMDAPHNTNDRAGGPGFHRPDYVERAS